MRSYLVRVEVTSFDRYKTFYRFEQHMQFRTLPKPWDEVNFTVMSHQLRGRVLRVEREGPAWVVSLYGWVARDPDYYKELLTYFRHNQSGWARSKRST
jgi:hypothetical protein